MCGQCGIEDRPKILVKNCKKKKLLKKHPQVRERCVPKYWGATSTRTSLMGSKGGRMIWIDSGVHQFR